ncbi:MAG: hypothetical protein BGO67_03120 [Alphaproteobacteria bacterium 41-28]|nr:MAG: hypothetical protein BGO67_03120 [Alphaproteobacteria bacterium 41-28]
MEYASTFVVRISPGLKQVPNPTHTRWCETWKPCTAPRIGTANCKMSLWPCRFGGLEEANAVL